MLLAGSNMLNHVGLEYYGRMIQSAVSRVLKAGKVSWTGTDSGWNFYSFHVEFN